MKSKEILLILFSRPFLVKFSACLFVVVIWEHNWPELEIHLLSTSPSFPPYGPVSEGHIGSSGTVGKISKPQSFPKCWLRSWIAWCAFTELFHGFPLHAVKQSIWMKWLYKALILASLWKNHLCHTAIPHTWGLTRYLEGGGETGWEGGGGFLEIKSITLSRLFFTWSLLKPLGSKVRGIRLEEGRRSVPRTALATPSPASDSLLEPLRVEGMNSYHA